MHLNHTIIIKRASFFLLCGLLALLASCSSSSFDLAGTWKFQIDREDVGEQEAWYSTTLKEEINLPGSMASNGLGDDITYR